MSSLFFMFELSVFALVAYWAYVNDQPGVKGGSKGLLRMLEAQLEQAATPSKRAPQWRKDHRGKPGKAKPERRGGPGAGRPAPAWKRRLG